MNELETFEKSVEHADAMFSKYESSVATLDNSTVSPFMNIDRCQKVFPNTF